MEVKSKENITRGMKIDELVDKHPNVIPILMGYGLHCVGCAFSGMDTLENGAKIHGMPEEDFEMMLRDLNAVVSEKIE
ncbi:disulfide oxidoreductase [Candidatus Pacearchaeota archaeon CG10_big_fil_rev_8_21_14_0_10_34_12]|nr:MAG: disulfide oxidoreductase [Candidatus Pacearchaeota archaeon CG10_big_fil_rev_8_21_14_0_10_34_12]